MNGIAAIILAQSSLPEELVLEPSHQLNGYSLLELATQTALDGGASTISVVMAQHPAVARPALATLIASVKGPTCKIAHTTSCVEGLAEAPLLPATQFFFNQHEEFFDETSFGAVKKGLEELRKHAATTTAEFAFVLPTDVSGVKPATYQALLEAANDNVADIIVPFYQGKQGYPLLISNTVFEELLASEETDLLQLLHAEGFQALEVDDPGVLLNAQTPEELKKLKQHIRTTRGVSKDIAATLFEEYQTPSNVHEHTRAVAEVAHRMARQLNELGSALDAELCKSGGELHDVCRLEPKHSEVAADNLQALGYTALSEVVRAHDSQLLLEPRLFTEANLVFVADKLVKDTTLVSIANRYKGALEKFPAHTPFGKLIKEDSQSSQVLLDTYVNLTGDAAILQGSTTFRRRKFYEET